MPRYVLSLRVDPPGGRLASTLAEQARERDFRRQFYRRFGLTLYSTAWAEVDLLTWPRLEEFTSAIEESQRRGEARLGSGLLFETLAGDEVDACEWFLVQSDAYADIDVDAYPTVRADRVPRGHTVLLQGQYVSERVKRAVEAAGLGGIEFLWIADVGRFQAPQWFVPIAAQPMGRGIDHRWFNADGTVRGRFAHGVWRFDGRALEPGWTTGNAAADRLLRLFPRDSSLGLMIQTTRRFARDEAPAADFAYDWEVGSDRMPGGGTRRIRTLCLSAKARRVLLDAGALTEADLQPVMLVDRPASAIVRPGVRLPPPVHTVEELAALRAEEQRRLAKFSAQSKPVRVPSLDQTLKLLRAAVRRRPADFGKRPRAADVKSAEKTLGVAMPDAWKHVLAVADGGQLGEGDADCRLVSCRELPEFHRERQTIGREAEDLYPETYVHVGDNASGDTYVLVVTGPSPDCAVALVSHETLQADRQWQSVGEFLDWALTG